MIRIGLIGTPKQVISRFDIISKVPGVEFSGYYNPVDDFQSEVEPKIKCVRRYEDLIAMSDALDFIPEEKKCIKLALQSLKASKHVLIKPSIIENKFQSNQLTKLANEAHVVLMIGSTVKYHAALNAALPQMKNLRLIEIQKQITEKSHNWENILIALLQDLDIIHTVLKSNLKNVKTTGIKMINGTPGIVNVRLEYDNGCVANLNASWIVNEDKYVAMFTQNDRITKVNFLENEITVLKPEFDSAKNGEYSLNPVTKKISKNDPNLEELHHFIKTIQNNSKLLSNPEDGFKSFIIAEKIMDNLNKVMVN